MFVFGGERMIALRLFHRVQVRTLRFR
jgi:hypothetical protein